MILSLDTGPHQGMVEGDTHFCVGSILGDFDCSCTINITDVQEVASRWRTTDENPNWDPRYDLNDDGIITVVDIMLVVKHWGQTCG